jgi:ABC-type multidrug transport system ATPase subunit
MKIVLGILRPDSGKINVCGIDVKEKARRNKERDGQ